MITEILNKVPQELLLITPMEEVIAPSFLELNDLARVDGVDLRVLVVRDCGRIRACAICYVKRRRHHGLQLTIYELFGYHLHDYSRLFAEDEEALDCLMQLAEQDAKFHHCDMIYWANIPKELVPSDHWKITSEMKIFNAKESEDGWKELYNRKSIKRFRNKAAKVAPYHVEVIDGVVPLVLMKELSSFHINRWRFAGSVSPFVSNKKRKEEYIVHPINKHYLRVMLGDELLACHYGMKYGKTLLWHTPVINPKYLALSPLRLLLGETALYCEKNGLEAIDFGLGDEAYKNGYCTVPRITCTYQRALSLRGQLSSAIALAHQKGIDQLLLDCKSIAKIIKDRFKCARVLKYISKKEEGKIAFDKRFVHISTWSEFYDFCLQRNYPLFMWQYERFVHDDSLEFVALADEKHIYSSGWASSKSPFPIGESGEVVELQGRVCLYDFVTPQMFRNKGYYTALLEAVRMHYGETFIYARVNNKASRKAIERSGFFKL